MAERVYRFRDIRSLATAVMVAAGASAVIAVVAVGSGWLELDLLSRLGGGEFVTQAEADSSDNRQFLIGILSILTYVVTSALFLRWVYLSNSNARALGSAGMHYTPAWAVGWYFVPIMSLWKPFLSMQEIFKASNPASGATNWQDSKAPYVVEIWWLLFLVMTFTGQVIVRVFWDAETLAELTTASRWALASDVVAIPAAIVMALMVAKLGDWQTEKAGLPVAAGPGSAVAGVQ